MYVERFNEVEIVESTLWYIPGMICHADKHVSYIITCKP